MFYITSNEIVELLISLEIILEPPLTELTQQREGMVNVCLSAVILYVVPLVKQSLGSPSITLTITFELVSQ